MIKALTVGAAGRPAAMVLGLTFTNLNRLAAGQPIGFSPAELGLRNDIDVLLMGGHTTAAIRAELATHGVHVPADEQDDAAGMLSFTVNRRVATHPRPLAVLGIGGTADAILRAGTVLEGRPSADLPVLRLLAGPDTDTLAQMIGPMTRDTQVIDLRGGRTD